MKLVQLRTFISTFSLGNLEYLFVVAKRLQNTNELVQFCFLYYQYITEQSEEK